MGARQKLNAVYLLGIVGGALIVGLLFQSPFIAIVIGAVFIWAAIDGGDIRLNSPRR